MDRIDPELADMIPALDESPLVGNAETPVAKLFERSVECEGLDEIDAGFRKTLKASNDRFFSKGAAAVPPPPPAQARKTSNVQIDPEILREFGREIAEDSARWCAAAGIF